MSETNVTEKTASAGEEPRRLGTIDPQNLPAAGTVYVFDVPNDVDNPTGETTGNLAGDDSLPDRFSLEIVDCPTIQGLIHVKYIDRRDDKLFGVTLLGDWNENFAPCVVGILPPGTAAAPDAAAAPAVSVEKKPKPLEWSEDGNLPRVIYAASRAYNNDGDAFYYCVRQRANRWHLDGSDGELISGVPLARLGPYPSLGDAQRVCQVIDNESFEALSSAERAGDPDVTREIVNVGVFDEKSPWPEGSLITLADGCQAYLTEVDLELDRITVRWVSGDPDDQHRTYPFDAWNRDWAPKVQEVRFPQEDAAPMQAPLAEVTDSAAAVPAPARLPIPRPSDVSLDLIDVVHNVRSEQSLFDESLASLGDSMDQQGQIETVKLLRKPDGRFRLLDGERRFLSAKASHLASLRAEVYDENLDEAAILRFQLTTFATRKDLTHREWATALGDYSQRLGLNAAELARAVGLKDDFVRKHLAYRSFPELVQTMVDGEKLSLNKAITIARLPANQQETWAQRAYLQAWSERQVSEAVNAILAPDPGGLLADATPTAEASPSVAPRDNPDTWRGIPLVELLSDVDDVDDLAEAGIKTLGDLEDLRGRRGQYWTEDLAGIGKAAQQRIEDAVVEFWASRPLPTTPPGAASGTDDAEPADGSDGDNGGDGPTDAFDQVNGRRAARANNPIPSKADTLEERRRQAQADSDAEAARAEKMKKAPLSEAILERFSGDLTVTGEFRLSLLNGCPVIACDMATFCLRIGRETVTMVDSMCLDIHDAQADEIQVAVNNALNQPTPSAEKRSGKAKTTKSATKPVKTHAPSTNDNPIKGVCRVCGKKEPKRGFSGTFWIDAPKMTLCYKCDCLGEFSTITHLDAKTVVQQTIAGCEDLTILQAATDYGLKGDWRRAAVAKRIKQLQKAATA